MSMKDRIAALEAECAALRAENEALRANIQGKAPGNARVAPPQSRPHLADALVRHDSATTDKVALFRSLFRGREDTYPLRWESKAGRSGYSPACANEWVSGICEKPRIKCADCSNKAFFAVSDDVIFDHLSGRRTLGVYPILHDDTCWFVAADFDETTWREDAMAYATGCRELGSPPTSKSRARAKALMSGPSLSPRSRQVKPGSLPAQRSRVRAQGIVPLPLPPTTGCFQVRTRCLRVGSVT